MQQNQIVPVVSIVNNHAITTSKDVAQIFDKQHSHVIRDINEIIKKVPTDFSAANFGSNKINVLRGAGEEISHYDITRDGFTILAMGFTGKKAMQFKIAYIEAFNKMEAELMSKSRFPELPPPTLTPDQQRKVQQIIGDKVYATGNKAMFPTYFKRIYSALKDKFHVGKYDQVPASQFDALTAFLEDYRLIPESDTVTREEFEALKKFIITHLESNQAFRDAQVEASRKAARIAVVLTDAFELCYRAHGQSNITEIIKKATHDTVDLVNGFMDKADKFFSNQRSTYSALLEDNVA